MHHPIDRIAHTTAFVTPVMENWLEQEIAQWVSTFNNIFIPLLFLDKLVIEIFLLEQTQWLTNEHRSHTDCAQNILIEMLALSVMDGSTELKVESSPSGNQSFTFTRTSSCASSASSAHNTGE